jgi:2-aminoadipate transaminase
MAFDFAPLIAPGAPAPAVKWPGWPRYNFTFGNNAPEEVPIDDLRAAADKMLLREGRRLAEYRLEHGPQGYQPLRQFLVGKLKRDAGIECTIDDLLIV